MNRRGFFGMAVAATVGAVVGRLTKGKDAPPRLFADPQYSGNGNRLWLHGEPIPPGWTVNNTGGPHQCYVQIISPKPPNEMGA